MKKAKKRRTRRVKGSGSVTPAPDKKEEDSIHSRTPSPPRDPLTVTEKASYTKKHNSSIDGLTQMSTQTQQWPYSVSKVRMSRMKIESDVVQMHNRIHLLEQEERRALRRIQETRQKADQILQIRHDQLKFKKELDSTRQTLLEEKLTRVKARNLNQSPEGSPENFVSGSVLLARQKTQKAIDAKHAEAEIQRRTLQKQLRERERLDQRQLKTK